MHFLTVLKSGAPLENVVKDFVDDLLKKSWEDNALCLDLACDFVHECLSAIGLSFPLTPEQIITGGTPEWPMEQIQIYSFHYVEMDFKKIEQFLLQMCSLIKDENENFLENSFDEETEQPLEFLMDLIAIWCHVYKKLEQMEIAQPIKRFEEPLARINFHLLLGMHDLRKIYREVLPILDGICYRLYKSASQGLFYPQPHDMILDGLLQIFSRDYDIFYEQPSQDVNFFYDAFTVEINNLTDLKLFKELQKMLTAYNEEDGSSPDNQGANFNKIKILVNLLIEPNMLNVYFNTFMAKKAEKNEKVKQEALKFLNVLQSKLLTLDCFSRFFMESILNLIFKSNANTATLASNLYIAMMQRSWSEQLILKHILDFYAAHVGSFDKLKPSVLIIYNSFKDLLNLNHFLEIISNTNNSEIVRIISAHMLVIVCELKYNENDSTAKQEVQHLLQILPELCENLQSQTAIGIVAQVFCNIPIKDLQNSTIDNFIHYAVGVFTNIEINFEYPLLSNIFVIFNKCIKSNLQWHHLELIAVHLQSLYREMILELQNFEKTKNEVLLKTSLSSYNSLIKRLNIIFKTNYDILDIDLLPIIKNLTKYFLMQDFVQTVIVSEKSFIDLYALEIIIASITKLAKTETANNTNFSFSTEAKIIYQYLLLRLKEMESVLKMPVIRIKTYFSSLLQLFAHLPLTLDNNIYHQLIQILINVNFKNKLLNRKLGDELQQLHPMKSLDYQRLMLRDFTELHKYQHIQINTNMVWKLCIYYGMSKHKFNEELKNLLITLVRHRLKIYKNIISVLIYNLYNQTPALTHFTIISILKKHRNLIDNEIPLESPNLLKVHVVLMVLQVIEKVLSVQRIKIGINRLEALKHLNIFIEDLDLNQLQAKQLMEEQLQKYEKYLLADEERKCLEDFKRLI